VRPFTLSSESVRDRCIAAIRALPLGYRVTIREAKRSDAQNDRMWAMLGDIVRAKPEWAGFKMTDYDYKDLITAHLKKQRLIPGIDEDGQPGGSLVIVGGRTSQMTVAEMSDVIEALYWLGAVHDVAWSEPTAEKYR
jgi:NinB protein